MTWENLTKIPSEEFRCGHCGNLVASDLAFYDEREMKRIYICPHCEDPTFFTRHRRQIPGVSPGNEVQHLPEELNELYGEARRCVSVGSYTSSVLACRKLLMNIAVSQGADEGLSFIRYVEYLANNGFVPPNGRGWVDHIRRKGNEATHEIALMRTEDAEELIAFAEMLLKFIYEFPARVPPDNENP